MYEDIRFTLLATEDSIATGSFELMLVNMENRGAFAYYLGKARNSDENFFLFSLGGLESCVYVTNGPSCMPERSGNEMYRIPISKMYKETTH
jgi:hypothetical protein